MIPEEEALAALNKTLEEHVEKIGHQEGINWVLQQFKKQHYKGAE